MALSSPDGVGLEESSGLGPLVCWGGGVSERTPYPSDLSDEQWALIEPVITAWKARHRSVSGHQGAYAMREIVNAILYQGRTGCQWTYLPHDLPQKSATYYYFAAWRDDGTDQVIHELLRCQVRERARRSEDPTLVVLDTQSVHVAAGVPASTTGLDPAKRVPGRKRGLAVDVLGLVIAVTVLAASAHDNAAGIARLDQVAEHAGETVRTALVDQGFKNQVAAHGADVGIKVEIVERNPKDTGFVPLPKRWRVEQTYAILILHRRLVRDYEHQPSSSASRVYWAMTHVMVRRLTGANAPTWRDPQTVAT
jgi:transposase